MDYTKFTVEDFASNESFINWVKKSDPEAVKHWDLYISRHPEIKPTVEKARALVFNMRLAEEVKHDPARIESMWAGIQRRVATEADAQTPEKSSRYSSKAVLVLSLVFLCACAVWFVIEYRYRISQSTDRIVYENRLPDFVEQVNETGKPLKIQLEDGSVVTLASKSRLKYKANYTKDSTRSIFLLGEAFFDVAKDPYKPFLVHSNEVLVKVLGTSFLVSAPENGKNIVVTVKTGKVSVFANKDGHKKDGVILLPNQKVSYEREHQLFTRALIDAPEILSPAIVQDDFMFDNTPIAEAFSVIQKAYGVEIIFNEDTMKDCYITAPLGSEPMMEKLNIICRTIGASFEIIDAKVVISSSGCSQ